MYSRVHILRVPLVAPLPAAGEHGRQHGALT